MQYTKIHTSLLLTLTFIFIFLAMTFGTAVHAATPTITANGVFAYTNAERYKRGLPFLSSNALLSQMAKDKMQDLFAWQYFAHESPSGRDVSDQADDIGYRYIAVGENLALGDFDSNKHVVEEWMQSSGHRENVLSKVYSEIGIAAGKSMYEGRYTWIVVQSFGLPKEACPAVDEELKSAMDVLEQRLEIIKTIVEIREKGLEEDGISRSELQMRVASYNVVARLHNNTAEKYQGYVDEYNEGVGEYNSCLKETVEKI